MAYRSSRRSGYGTRPRRRTPYRRTRYAAKRPSYRRRSTVRRRAPMTRRRVLNISSRKKQDNMLPRSGTAFQNDGNIGPIVVPGNKQGGAVIAWICTARDMTDETDPDGTNVTMAATRTAQWCYMRGLKEKIDIYTNSPHTWYWRRIVFTYKGSELLFPQAQAANPDAGKLSRGSLWSESSAGYERFMADLNRSDGVRPVDNVQLRDQLVEVLFKGQINRDWRTGRNAKVDNQRVRVMHDKTTMLRSGNDRGTAWMKKRWHPFNKSIMYNDDENGAAELSGYLSTSGRAGMGDVYVIDFIEAAPGASASDQLGFEPQATLYWHER